MRTVSKSYSFGRECCITPPPGLTLQNWEVLRFLFSFTLESSITESLLKIYIISSTPDLLNQHLHFNKPLDESKHTLKEWTLTTVFTC